MSVVPVTDDDIPALLEVYQQSEDFLALGPDPSASTQMVVEDIEGSRQRNGQFCAIKNHQGVAIGVLDFIPDTRSTGSSYLSLLMIAAPWRGRGYGRAVAEALEVYQQATCDIERMGAAVQINNSNAIRFWKSLGYAVSDEPSEQSDGTVIYKMTKVLPRT